MTEKHLIADTAGSPIDGPTNEIHGKFGDTDVVVIVDTDDMKELPEEKPHFVPNRHDRRKAAALARKAKV